MFHPALDAARGLADLLQGLQGEMETKEMGWEDERSAMLKAHEAATSQLTSKIEELKVQSEKLKEKVKHLYAIGARHSQTSQLLGKKLVHEKQKHSKTRKEKEELEQRLKLLECNATVNIEGARPKPEDKNSNNAFNIPSALTDENFQTKITHPQAGLKRSREDRDPELLRKKASPILPSLEIFESPEDLQPVVSKKEKPSVSSSHSLRTRNPPTSMPSSIGLDQSSIDSYFKKKSEKPKEKRKSSPSDLKLCIHDFGPIKSIRNEKQDQTKARSLQQLQPPGYLSPPEPEGTLKHTDTILVGEKQGSPLQGKSSWNDCKEPQKENFPPPTKVSLYKEHKPTAVEDKSKIQCEDQEEATELSSNSNEESSDQGAIRDPFLPKQYVEVVRKKAERAKLPGHACEQCKKYYAVMNQWGFGSQQEIANRCSRHRDRYEPYQTPDGFWDLSFPDEKEAKG